jgi:hypothetical protein
VAWTRNPADNQGMAFDWRIMENESTLQDIIQESMEAEDPSVDTQGFDEELDSDDVSVEDLLAGIDDDDDDIEDDEGVDEDSDLAETFQVKVDGEVVDVTLKEALAGYQRQADYTRKAQALAAEREELQMVAAQFGDTLETVAALDAAWEENPVQVLHHFLGNTENPTHSLALLIKEAASAGMLERDFLQMFGITPDIQQAWAKEGEVETLRRKVSRTEQSEAQKRQEAEYEAEVQRALAEYERQIDDILQAEGLTNVTVSQRNAFRQRLAAYAHQNDLTNLTAAYKALKYEEGQKKRQVAAKTKERAAQKRNASAVGRSGAGAAGAAPVVDSTDLSAVIRQAMDEASAKIQR